MSAQQQHRSSQGDLDILLDMVGTLKDEMHDLRETHHQSASMLASRSRRIAPGHTHDEPWTPCDREEIEFYGSLAYLQ